MRLTCELTTCGAIAIGVFWAFYVLAATSFFRPRAIGRVLLATALALATLAPRLACQRRAPGELAIVVDDSQSMARTLGDGDVWEQATRLACELADVARAQGRDVVLQTLSGEPFESSAPTAPRSELDRARQAPRRVLLLTDGVVELAETQSGVPERRPRVDAIVLGKASTERDWRWERATRTSVVYPTERARFDGVAALVGSNAQGRVVARLWNADARTVVWRETLESDDSGRVSVQIDWEPSREEPTRYRLELVDEADSNYLEDSNFLESARAEASGASEFCLENNVVEFDVTPRERKLRVLLLDDVPRYEYRYLRELLRREETIELRTTLLSADPRTAEADPLAVALDALDRETLASFDVVLLGALKDERWNAPLDRLTDVVTREGSATSVWALGTDLTRRPRLAPCEPIEAPESDDVWRPIATSQARLLFDDVWSDVESLELSQVCGATPNATAETFFVARDVRGRETPCALVEDRGSNKIAWQGWDETWRLQTFDDKSVYRTFVLRALDYLTTSTSGGTIAARSSADASELASEKNALERADVAARLEPLASLTKRSGGETLDLRDRSTYREVRDEARAFFERRFESEPTERVWREFDLAPRRVVFPLVLTLYLLVWTLERRRRA